MNVQHTHKCTTYARTHDIFTNSRHTTYARTYARTHNIHTYAPMDDIRTIYAQTHDIHTNARHTHQRQRTTCALKHDIITNVRHTHQRMTYALTPTYHQCTTYEPMHDVRTTHDIRTYARHTHLMTYAPTRDIRNNSWHTQQHRPTLLEMRVLWPLSKNPPWFFCETRGSFDGVGFFWIRKGALMYPTGLEGSLASSWHRGFFECNTSVGVYLSANVGMIF